MKKENITTLESILDGIGNNDANKTEELIESCFEINFIDASFYDVLTRIIYLVESKKLDANQRFHFYMECVPNESKKTINFTPLSIALCCHKLTEANTLIEHGSSSFKLLDTISDNRYKKYTEENFNLLVIRFSHAQIQ